MGEAPTLSETTTEHHPAGIVCGALPQVSSSLRIASFARFIFRSGFCKIASISSRVRKSTSLLSWRLQGIARICCTNPLCSGALNATYRKNQGHADVDTQFIYIQSVDEVKRAAAGKIAEELHRFCTDHRQMGLPWVN
jgi:hypothetical protein